MNLALQTTVATEYGIVFQTGRPVCFTYARNTARSPNLGEQFQQHIEPHGRYMLHVEPDAPVAEGWEKGRVCFKKPLVLPLNERGGHRTYDAYSWKANLARTYGAYGLRLTQALVKEGFDGIVTTVGATETREIVQLPKRVGGGWDWSWG